MAAWATFSWRGIYTSRVIHPVPRVKVTRGTGHARDSLEWNTCRHKRAVNIRYSSAINLQKDVKFSPQL